ncbi:MAG: lysostaphin resistance A-like protein [Chloroflexota bacterium]
MRGSPRFSWPTWVIIVGAVLTLPGIVGAALTVGLSGFHAPTLLSVGLKHPVILALLGLSIVGIAVFSIGLVAYVVVGSLSHQRAERGYGTLGTILACLGVAVIVANLLTLPYFLVQQAQHPTEAVTLTPGGLVYSIVALDLVLVAIVYFRIVRPHVLSWSQLGLTISKLGERVGLGIGVGILVILGSAAIEAALQAVGIHQTQEQMFEGVLNATIPQFIGVLLAGAVIAPIAEETFFRGYVFGAARRTYGLVPAFALSALLFALAHLNAEAFIPILLIGVAFCYVYWKTQSLVPSMIAHMMNNAVALITLYFLHR